MSEHTGAARFVTEAGTVVLCEEEHALPLVHVSLSLRTGSVHDPRGAEGVVRACVRLLRMGTRKLTAPQVEERIDAMGAHLGVGCSASYVHIGGVVVAHNLEKFVALMGELIRSPAFRATDLADIGRRKQQWLRGGIDVIEINHGWCTSIYAVDPNGILVEFCTTTSAFSEADKEEARRLFAYPQPPVSVPPDIKVHRAKAA